MRPYIASLIGMLITTPLLASDLSTEIDFKAGRYTFHSRIMVCDLKIIPEKDGSTSIIGKAESPSFIFWKKQLKTFSSNYKSTDSLSNISQIHKNRRFSDHFIRQIHYIAESPQDALEFLFLARQRLIHSFLDIKNDFRCPVFVYTTIEIYGINSPENRDLVRDTWKSQEIQQIKETLGIHTDL